MVGEEQKEGGGGTSEDTTKPSEKNDVCNDGGKEGCSGWRKYWLLHLVVAGISLSFGIITPVVWERIRVGRLYETELEGDDDYPTDWSHAYHDSRFPLPVFTPSTAQGKGERQENPNESDGEQAQRVEQEVELGTEALDNPCGDVRLEDFQHNDPVGGYHIVCLRIVTRNTNVSELLRMKLYRGGTISFSVVDVPMPVTWSDFRQELETHLGLPLRTATDGRQPWALFSSRGEHLVSADQEEAEEASGEVARTLASEFGAILLYEGGQFLWPGVRIGFERRISLYSVMPKGSPDLDYPAREATLETLSLSPLILSVKGFLSQDECRYVQSLAEPSMKYSSVVMMDHDKKAGRSASDFRTSQTVFLTNHADDSVLVDIDYRTASLIRMPRTHQEHVQVLRYGPTERYSSHHDYFDPALYRQDRGTLRLTKNGLRNRMATVFWYLSDVEAGGETVFPRFNGGRERDFEDCETGLLVKPEMGKVIIFYSMTADGRMDPSSLHGSCPVKEGIKWAANKWVWNEPMNYIRS